MVAYLSTYAGEDPTVGFYVLNEVNTDSHVN